MQTPEKHLFEKISKLAKTIKNDFKNKGIIIPIQNNDGTIQIGTYTINKFRSLFYIKDKTNETILGPLNLAQSAIVIANDLALGKKIDKIILNNDKWYGYKAFDEASANNIVVHACKENDYDKVDLISYKAFIAAEQKRQYKKTIDSRFNKLYRLT
jgi:hypothetical protein